MDERDVKLQKLEVHRRDMAFVRGYVTCATCACNYNASKPEEKTYCQIYGLDIRPDSTEGNILRAEACEQWVHEKMDRHKVVTPDHRYRYDRWGD